MLLDDRARARQRAIAALEDRPLDRRDQFDTLYADSACQSRVIGMPLHPMIVGQPLRSTYLERALAHMRTHERVWFATGNEIIDDPTAWP